MKLLSGLLIVFAATTLVAAESPGEPPRDGISTWVLLKLTEAGCTVRADPAAMSGAQIRLKDSLTPQQYNSITEQTLYLATDCNTRQAMAEAALLEQAAGSKMRMTPRRINATAAIYDVSGPPTDVSALLVLTPLGDQSGVAVITMSSSSP